MKVAKHAECIFEGAVNLLSSLVSGYDDSGFANSTVNTINTSFTLNGINAQIHQHPISLGFVASGRLIGMSVVTIIQLNEQIETHQREMEAQKNLQDALKKGLAQLTRYQMMLSKQFRPNWILDQDELRVEIQQALEKNKLGNKALWNLINRTSIRLILASYRLNRHFISKYDANKLCHLLLTISNNDAHVMDAYLRFIQQSTNVKKMCEYEKELIRKIDAIITRKNKQANNWIANINNGFKVFLDFLLANTTGMSVISGSASLLSLIFGVKVIVLGVLIAALVGGVIFGTAKLLNKYYFKPKHAQITKKVQNHSFREKIAAECEALRLHSFTFSQHRSHSRTYRINNLDEKIINQAMITVSESKTEARAFLVAHLINAVGLSILIGWSAVSTINSVVSGLGAIIGSSVSAGLTGALATTIPIMGIVLTSAIYIAQALNQVRQDREKEQILKKQYEQKLSSQNLLAHSDNDLQKVVNYSEIQLVRLYIQRFAHNLSMSITVSDQAKDEFIQRIEKVIGFTRAEAKSDDDFISYLAYKINSNQSAVQLKNILNGTPGAQQHISPNLEKVKKNWFERTFKRDADGKVDYRGNFRRFMNTFKHVSEFVFGVVGPVGVGMGIALTLASGPAFPYVAACMAAVLLGAFIVKKIIEHKRNQRLLIYNQNLAKLDMQYHAVELVDQLNAAKVKTTTRKSAVKAEPIITRLRPTLTVVESSKRNLNENTQLESKLNPLMANPVQPNIAALITHSAIINMSTEFNDLSTDKEKFLLKAIS